VIILSPLVFTTSKQTADTKSDGSDEELAYALQLLEFEEPPRTVIESTSPQAQFEPQPTFQCGVCLEEQPEHEIARFHACLHLFCRSCLRQHIQAKLAERRYPILCPVCATDGHNTEPGGTLCA
jgi:hypothetical protein